MSRYSIYSHAVNTATGERWVEISGAGDFYPERGFRQMYFKCDDPHGMFIGFSHIVDNETGKIWKNWQKFIGHFRNI